VVKRLTDVLVVSHEKTAQIVDARPAPRFNAEADEPRPGLKRGHIPGALNVPWGDLVFEGELKTTDELRAIFDRAGRGFTSSDYCQLRLRRNGLRGDSGARHARRKRRHALRRRLERMGCA
jgi:3-mercaptopyruvate sulfurtransferase SseA